MVKKYAELNNQKWWMFFAGLLFFILGIAVAVIAAMNAKAIKQAAAILRYSISVILKNPQLVIIGIICFALQIVVIFLGIWILIGIYTSGTMERDAFAGEPIPDFSIGFFRWIFVLLTLVAIYWIVNFINNVADFISAATTTNYYFNKPNRFGAAVRDTLKFHLGSVALGSLILAPITFL